MKNKKLHDIMKHSNYVTKKLVEMNSLDNPKEIAKINQITDLFISVNCCVEYRNSKNLLPLY